MSARRQSRPGSSCNASSTRLTIRGRRPVPASSGETARRNALLIALAVSANGDENARLALAQLGALRGCDVHESVILGSVDEGIFRALGIQVTTEPVYATKSLYRKK